MIEKYLLKPLKKILPLSLQKVASNNKSLSPSEEPTKHYTIADRLLIEEFLVNWKK